MPPLVILILFGGVVVVAIFARKYLIERRESAKFIARNAAREKRAFALALSTPERLLIKMVREAGSDDQLHYFREGSEASQRQQALRYLNRYKDHFVFRYRDMEPLDIDLWKSGEKSLTDIFSNPNPTASKKAGRRHALGVLSSMMTTMTKYTDLGDEISACVAGNCALTSELSRLYAQVGLISDEEAWGLLYLNAEHARAAFSDWASYIEAWERNLLSVADYSDNANIKRNLKAISAVAAKQKKKNVNWLRTGVFDDLRMAHHTKSVPSVKQRQGA